jgi:nonsense-mediated mRNA decay protein 3
LFLFFNSSLIADKPKKENDYAMAEDSESDYEDEDFPEIQLDELLDNLKLDDGPDNEYDSAQDGDDMMMD